MFYLEYTDTSKVKLSNKSSYYFLEWWTMDVSIIEKLKLSFSAYFLKLSVFLLVTGICTQLMEREYLLILSWLIHYTLVENTFFVLV